MIAENTVRAAPHTSHPEVVAEVVSAHGKKQSLSRRNILLSFVAVNLAFWIGLGWVLVR